MIHIYTDGSSRGNPGPGGYGIVMKWNGHRKEMSEGFRKTTNNRMELLSVIVALESLKRNNESVVVFSDSKYVVDAVEKGWVFGWEKKAFRGKKNGDLWKRFLKIYPEFEVKFRWIKGHNDHPENEMCDQMAVDAAQGIHLKVDEGFESGLYN
jgi:ribonuclease HI